MEDVTLVARLDADTTVYVSPMHDHTYQEFVGNDTLGGARGYFVTRQRHDRYEVLAKAASLDAAREIFALIIGGSRITG